MNAAPQATLDTDVPATVSVLATLRADVVSGYLRPGDQVVQERLAERYGVSRAPLREALRLLESEGQVVHEPNRGYFVTQLSVSDLQEVYRLRALLEAEAITEAVPRLSPADLDAIAALAADVQDASRQADLARLTDANRNFHFAIFESSGMPRLVRLLRQLWDATDAYRAVYFDDAVNRDRVEHEHDVIVGALRAGDCAGVIEAHAAHRANSATTVSALLNGRSRPAETA